MQENILFAQLKELVDKYGRWGNLTTYVNRIETYLEADFSIAVENSESLIETIAKTILEEKDVALNGTESINKLVKLAFKNTGYSENSFIQISSALTTISQQIGQLRSEVGITSHGRPVNELSKRNNKINNLTKKLIIHSTEIVAILLIEAYEIENPRIHTSRSKINYEDEEEFNNFLDETYGEFEIGGYSYLASEILFYVDYEAYETELKNYKEQTDAEP